MTLKLHVSSLAKSTTQFTMTAAPYLPLWICGPRNWKSLISERRLTKIITGPGSFYCISKLKLNENQFSFDLWHHPFSKFNIQILGLTNSLSCQRWCLVIVIKIYIYIYILYVILHFWNIIYYTNLTNQNSPRYSIWCINLSEKTQSLRSVQAFAPGWLNSSVSWKLQLLSSLMDHPVCGLHRKTETCPSSQLELNDAPLQKHEWMSTMKFLKT